MLSRCRRPTNHTAYRARVTTDNPQLGLTRVQAEEDSANEDGGPPFEALVGEFDMFRHKNRH